MAARIGNVTFDRDDVLKIAAFWSAVLGRPLNKGGNELFASMGDVDAKRPESAWYFGKGARAEASQEPRAPRSGEPRPVSPRRARGARCHGRRRTSAAGRNPSLDRDAGPEGNEFCIAAKASLAGD